MSKYARIEANEVVEVRNMPDNFTPAEVAHKFDWRIVELQPDPAFNQATQKLESWDYVISQFKVTAQKVVTALTQQEQNAYTQHQSDVAERAQAKALYQALKNGTGTQGERLLRVEKVLARLLRDAYGV